VLQSTERTTTVFEPGQRVVCVDDIFDAWVPRVYRQLPVAMQTYTVRDVLPGIEADNRTATAAILLVGIENDANTSGFERGFAPWRFVPLEEYEQATDAAIEDEIAETIEELQEMLK